MIRLMKLMSFLLAITFIFNAPLSVFAKVQASLQTHEKIIPIHDDSEVLNTQIPNNALLFRGKTAIKLFDKTRDISVFKPENLYFDRETFSLIAFNTEKELIDYIDKINSIEKGFILPSQILTITISKSDMSKYQLQNVNDDYSASFDSYSDSDEIEIYAVVASTAYCIACKAWVIVKTIWKILTDFAEFFGTLQFVCKITKMLLCNHTINDSYGSQTSCPHASYCMGTPYLVQDNNGHAIFACSCGATWDIWY